MKAVRRGGLHAALVAAAVLLLGSPTRAAVAGDRDYATVGPVVSRRVDTRTVVIVPVAGPFRARLSEPIRVSNRWRLLLTIEDARLAVGASPRRPEGVQSLAVTEIGSDVRVTIEVRALGDYGARPSEEGYLIWVDPKPREVDAGAAGVVATTLARSAGVEPEQAAAVQATSPQPPAQQGGFGSLVFLGVAAAAAGLAVQYVRRHGVPDWARELSGEIGRQLKVRLYEGARSAVLGRRGESADPLKAQMGPDPRGRSADIGDAFRVEPDTPASGIAALATPPDDR